MIEHISQNWYMYWGVFASVAYVWYRYRQTDPDKPASKRARSVLAGAHYHDSESETYSPGLPGRQFLIVGVGLVLVAGMLFIVWLLQ